MYNVSADYKNKMQSNIQHHKVYGTIGSVAFTEANIITGSLQVLLQCSGNSEVQIGQVIVGEMQCTFCNINIPRGQWQGKEIILNFAMLVGDDESDPSDWEEVPIGIFTIDEADWSESGMTIKAYDHLAKMDKRCSQRFTATQPFVMLEYACTQCGLLLGNTQQEIEAMPNGQDSMTEYPDNDIETWRDFVAWLSQTLGGFAYAGRDGKIYVKQYTQTVVDILDQRHRHTGAKFSDFSTRYTGISVVNIKYGTTNYYSVPVDNGLTYNLGQNPFLQNYENGTERRARILTALQQINYVPFALNMIGNIAYDLGDVLQFIGGVAGEGVNCCITKILYRHKQGVTVQGVGKNPASASAKSKTDKNISGILNRTASSEFRFENIFCGREVTVQPSLSVLGTKITDTDLNTGDSAQISALTEIQLAITQDDPDVPAELTFTHVVDNEVFEYRIPKETLTEGNHVVALQHYLTLMQGSHKYAIWLNITGGTATLSSSMDAVQTLFGTGLHAKSAFDGNLEVTETYAGFEMPTMSVIVGEDSVSSRMIQIQPRQTIDDEIGEVGIGEIGFDWSNVTDSVTIVQELASQQRITEIVEDRHTEDENERWTEGV